MSRYGASYSRTGQNNAAARNKAFDAAVAHESRLSITMTSAKSTKWGKTCFTSSRSINNTDNDYDTKRRKIDSLATRKSYETPRPLETSMETECDPFNFDSDDDKRFKRSGYIKTEVGSKHTDSYRSTYTSDSKGLKLKVSREPVTKSYTSKNSRSSNSAGYVDPYAKYKSSMCGSLSSRRLNISDENLEKTVTRPGGARKYKFFTSKKKGLNDHNYVQDDFGDDNGSISSSASDISNSQQFDTASVNSMNSAHDVDSAKPRQKSTPSYKSTDFGFGVSDAESEDDIPESGDPEIVFNSSKKCNSLFEDDEAANADTDDCESIASSQDRTDNTEKTKLTSKGSLQSRLSNKLLEMESVKRPASATSSLKRNGSGSFARRLLTSPKKSVMGKAVYNPRQWGDEDGDDDADDISGSSSNNRRPTASTSSQRSAGATKASYDFGDSDGENDRKGKRVSPPAATSSSSVGQEIGDDANDVKESHLASREPQIRRHNRRVPSRGAGGLYGFDDDEQKVSALRVTREHKQLFTVVRNVKEAHLVQEHGENQEFLDDMEYIMDGLPDTQTISVRCLSTMSLVNKCTEPPFRMHLRAHDIICKVFSALHDAPKYPTLALCTAAVMFMCSRDRLTMDLDKPSLELMLQLLSGEEMTTASTHKSTLSCRSNRMSLSTQKELRRLHTQIYKACEIVKKSGAAAHLNMQDISAESLAMEALLSLTSKRTGAWFKEELRSLGGLDHLVNIVSGCLTKEDETLEKPDAVQLARFKKIERCLRVLESVTHMNMDNQNHLIAYKSYLLPESLAQCLRICSKCLPHNSVVCTDNKVDKDCTGFIIMSCMLAALRVLINLTHESEMGCTRVGQQADLVPCVLTCILQLPKHVPEAEKFDILVLGLGLLINMVEHCDFNKHNLIDSDCDSPYLYKDQQTNIPALHALIQLFLIHYEGAIEAENEQEELKKSTQKNGKKKGKKKEGSNSDKQQPQRVNSNVSEMRRQLLEQRNSDPSKMVTSVRDNLADASGEWRESDSGIEWVSNPQNTEEVNENTGKKQEDPAGGDSQQTLSSDAQMSDSQNCDSQNTDSLPVNMDNDTKTDNDEEENVSEDDSDFDIMASQENDESYTKALHKAGRHMEDSIVAAYLSLLVGCVIENNIDLVNQVRELLTDGSFEPMIYMLRKFLGFMNLITAVSNTGAKSILRIIETLEAC